MRDHAYVLNLTFFFTDFSSAPGLLNFRLLFWGRGWWRMHSSWACGVFSNVLPLHGRVEFVMERLGCMILVPHMCLGRLLLLVHGHI